MSPHIHISIHTRTVDGREAVIECSGPHQMAAFLADAAMDAHKVLRRGGLSAPTQAPPGTAPAEA